ncbi:MAG: hypothetical protein ACHQQQ_10980 [Bacteroidota bacterium]
MINHSKMKLGKRAPRHDPRTLQLGNYLKADLLPTPPPVVDWTPKVKNWGMMKNDSIGDCTCAAAGHLIMEWTANASREATPPDAAIVKAYAAITGYNPVTGANDNGATETDVLNYWRTKGIGGHKIIAYAALEPKNHDHIKDSVYLLGDVYIGLALPLSAQHQVVWTVPPGGPTGSGAPGSWGGHAVPVVGYDSRGLTVVTWGALKTMTWSFWEVYCDEAYAVLSHDWIGVKGNAPEGVDLSTLLKDLQSLTH